MSVDDFCEHCGVVRSLHDWPDSPQPDCENAEAKADLIARFYSFGQAT